MLSMSLSEKFKSYSEWATTGTYDNNKQSYLISLVLSCFFITLKKGERLSLAEKSSFNILDKKIKLTLGIKTAIYKMIGPLSFYLSVNSLVLGIRY